MRSLAIAYEDSADVFDLLDDAESKLFEITNNHLRKNFDTIDSVLVKTIQRIEDLRHKNEDVTGGTERVCCIRPCYIRLAEYGSYYTRRPPCGRLKQLLL
ncbi:MAG: hypothetical protein WDO71_16965 [Bacteroidota bacterium]